MFIELHIQGTDEPTTISVLNVVRVIPLQEGTLINHLSPAGNGSLSTGVTEDYHTVKNKLAAASGKAII